MIDPELKGLKPWGRFIAIEERVQLEDTVRWARREEKRPLYPDDIPKEKRGTIIGCVTGLLP